MARFSFRSPKNPKGSIPIQEVGPKESAGHPVYGKGLDPDDCVSSGWSPTNKNERMHSPHLIHSTACELYMCSFVVEFIDRFRHCLGAPTNALMRVSVFT